MGASVSRSAKGKLSLNLDNVTKKRSKENNPFRLDVMYMSRAEAEDILTESTQKTGSYILYEDLDKQKMYIALKRVTGQVSHHFIHCYNDLYYFDDFPFPYVRSIILYYSKHKFKDTKFTQQAFVEPYLTTGQKSVRRQLGQSSSAAIGARRRHSSSTVSATSFRKDSDVQHVPSFRKVDPDRDFMTTTMTAVAASGNSSTLHRPVFSAGYNYQKNKSLATSTPNIVLESACESLDDVTDDLYAWQNQRRQGRQSAVYEQSSVGSTISHASDDVSGRVAVDSDSGYAVSVSASNINVGRRPVTFRRPRARVTHSFRLLTAAHTDDDDITVLPTDDNIKVSVPTVNTVRSGYKTICGRHLDRNQDCRLNDDKQPLYFINEQSFTTKL